MYIYGVAWLSGGRWEEEEGFARIRRSLMAARRLFGREDGAASAYYALGSLHMKRMQVELALTPFQVRVCLF